MSSQARKDAETQSATEDHSPATPKQSSYPVPFIIEPTAPHKQTWIVLHGRGDTAKPFSIGPSGFLRLRLPSGLTLQETLPHVRFVFPTASLRRAQVFARAEYPQWFDVYSWNSEEKTDWQVEGLRETTAWIHELMRREIGVIGAENVVLGGLSQGCASSLIALLLWEGVPIRSCFGMSGWLPFRHVLEGVAQETGGEKDASGVESETGTKDGGELKDALGALCKELGVPQVLGSTSRTVPVWMGHGIADNTVDIGLGRRAVECLKKLGLSVTWEEYEDLEHWMRGDELADIVRWVDAQQAPRVSAGEGNS